MEIILFSNIAKKEIYIYICRDFTIYHHYSLKPRLEWHHCYDSQCYLEALLP